MSERLENVVARFVLTKEWYEEMSALLGDSDGRAVLRDAYEMREGRRPSTPFRPGHLLWNGKGQFFAITRVLEPHPVLGRSVVLTLPKGLSS